MHSNDIIYSFLRTAIKDGIYVAVNIKLTGPVPPFGRTPRTDYAMRKAVLTLIILLIIPGVCLGEGTTALRQQMAGYLRSGSTPSAIPGNHPLALLKRAPVTATVAWLLFHDEPFLLTELYPVIDRTVMDYFSEERSDGNNFIAGYWLDDSISGAVCPGLNTLAALDLHSLSLIAAATGRNTEAIELRKLSRDYIVAITEYFFDHTNGLFLSVSGDGSYAPVYKPGQLLPLILDGRIDIETRTRVAGRLLYETSRNSSTAVTTLWDDPSARIMITSLLSGSDGFPQGRLERLPHSTGVRNVPQAWRSLWNNGESREVLFPVCDELFVLNNLAEYLGESGLMLDERLETLSSDLDTLTLMLSGDTIDLDTHVEIVSTVNRMLASISEISTTIADDERIWKIFEEYRWDGLSRRDQKLIAQAFLSSIDELLEAKRISSAGFIRATGLHADVRLPDRPVPAGRKIEMEARIWTAGIQLDIERIYLQAGANRWKFTESGESLSLKAGAAPMIWNRTLSVPPGTEPGIRPVPFFFDFMNGGKRIEMHSMASVILTSGYDISLNYPGGRRLSDDALPLNITVRYGTEHPIQGVIEGVFFRDLGCTPELPARFMIKTNTDITTLPLTIDPPESLPPGRYPFTLSVKIDGSTVAAFEDELVKPVRWLHLGPLPNRGWVIDNATSLQSDLYGTHTLSDGRELCWSRVPHGAFDEYGSVLPDRLYGSGSDRCMLLYTMVTSDKRRKVCWKIKSDNVTNFWINEIPLLGSGTSGSSKSGVTMLREGRNAFLVASAWNKLPDRIMLEISDENGMPLAGIGNDVNVVVRDFARVNETTDKSSLTPLPSSGEPREVTFTIDHPDASEVSLIGEFNNWSPETNPMKLTGSGMWSVTVTLPPGTYSYKFLIDRKQKLPDPASKGSEPDGFGGTNSVKKIK